MNHVFTKDEQRGDLMNWRRNVEGSRYCKRDVKAKKHKSNDRTKMGQRNILDKAIQDKKNQIKRIEIT